jgi:hypothetical protein
MPPVALVRQKLFAVDIDIEILIVDCFVGAVGAYRQNGIAQLTCKRVAFAHSDPGAIAKAFWIVYIFTIKGKALALAALLSVKQRSEPDLSVCGDAR